MDEGGQGQVVLVWEGKTTTDLTPFPRDILGKGVAVARGRGVGGAERTWPLA